MKLWERYWFAPVDTSRPFLLLRGLLMLLAFDCWLDLVPHGGRYGVGDFNVAHVPFLDLIQPVPTPEIYVGVLIATGLLAFTLAAGRPSRGGLVALFLLYTYGWSMSMMDSYQHHYLLSLLLLSAAFFPLRTATEVFGRVGGAPKPSPEATPEAPETEEDEEPAAEDLDARGQGGKSRKAKKKAKRKKAEASSGKGAELRAARVQKAAAVVQMRTLEPAWAYVSFGVTAAIVYFYTAITKMDPDWREGHALSRLGNTEAFQMLKDEYVARGWVEADFWKFMAMQAIAVQLVCATGYALTSKQEVVKKTWVKAILVLLGLAPLSFHIGVEHMELEIGWFSYYMLYACVIFFAPAKAVRAAGALVTWPVRWVEAQLEAMKKPGGEEKAEDERFSVAVLGVASAALVGGLAYALDLPGALGAGVVGAVGVLVGVAVELRHGRMGFARRLLGGAILAAGVMWASVANSDVRYDYYRFVGGDHRRRGELEEALVAYVKANKYAPRDPAQRAQPVGDCNERLGYKWDGRQCLELRGCRCEGRDCGDLRQTRRQCAKSFGSDRDQKEREVRQRLGLPVSG